MRYLMLLLQARARGADPGPPGVELFTWFENAWSLFPVVHLLVLIYATYLLGSLFGGLVLLVVDLFLVAVIPASLAVLAITRSPVECLRPRAVIGLIFRCGIDYWVAPAFMLIATILIWWLGTLQVFDFLLEFVSFYLLFVFFGLLGGLIRPFGLDRELGIPEPREPDVEQVREQLDKERRKVLNHAYGFISRDNRAGGLEHVYAWLAHDPDPESAWSWFADQMLRWEINDAALPFAQQYLSRLLQAGEQAPAVKLMMRCRSASKAFRPLPEDAALMLAAAEYCHNDELISFLR